MWFICSYLYTGHSADEVTLKDMGRANNKPQHNTAKREMCA